MKTMKKALLLALCAVLLVAASVAGTLAYLTAQDSVTNTFTVGKVEIELKEYDMDVETGKKLENATAANAVKELTDLKLVPGRVIEKNPFITVGEESEPCWLFVKIENGLDGNVTLGGMDGWNAVDGKSGYYMYNDKVAANAVVNVFTSVTVKPELGNAEINELEDKTISVTAYAVQAEGVEKQDAWGALDTHYELN